MESLSRRAALRAGVAGGAAIGGAFAFSPAAHASAVAPGEDWISVTDHGAVGDGVTDDTAAIQAALNAARAVTPHRSVHFPAGRVYRVSDQLTASGLTDVVIAGQGATLALRGAAAASPGGKSVLRLAGCRRFVVTGLTIKDTDRTQSYNGLGMAQCEGGTVEGVTVLDMKWNGIGVFDPTPRTSHNIAIHGCVVEGSRFGISTNGRDVRITGNHVAMYWQSTAEAAAKGGVWSTPSDYYDGINVLTGADRTVVSDNTVTECGQGGIYTQDVTNLVIADNTVTGCELRGIEVDGTASVATGVTITGNVVTGCYGQINLVKTRDVVVVGNRTANPNPAKAVSCIAINIGTAKAVVVGNHFDQSHPSHPAVYVESAATDVTVAWNSVVAAVPYQNPTETVLMYRSGPAQIKTNAKFIAAGGIGVGNSAPAGSVGSVVRKIEVFSATGASLGWIPVYNSIT
ncbi:right-handed parallel beta-helix repeat-containing protein [Micromonospora lupini]|uniref:right-handed parallel beta-helix repeat-containing protein n=1 Tax=Micromonospora lupini TaxID=285679 RepID=UPI0033E1002E